MELIEIMDENGNPTGEVMERDEAKKRNLLHNEIVVFVVNEEKKVILQKRALTKKLAPGKWALPAGHVDAGETVKQCAVREIDEEMGIKVSEDDLKPLKEKVIAINPVHSHIMYFYYVETDMKIEDFVLQEEEVAEVKYWDINEIVRLQNAGDPDILYEDVVQQMFLKLKDIIGA